jgi:transcriptional regulator GlxA family with amidase domain
MSRAGFARRFAETVGQTPAAYLTGLRVERAAELLQSTGATVASVAGETGFASEFSLNSAFKRRYGVSPGRWRRAAVKDA